MKNRKRCSIKLAIITSLVVIATIGIVVWAVAKDSSSSSSVVDGRGVDTLGADTSNPDDDSEVQAQVEQEIKILLYEVPILNNPSTDYVEGSFRIYSKYLLSNPLNVTYSMSIDFTESSTITNIFDHNENSDERNDDNDERNSLCFTDNLFLLERNLIDNDDIHLKHPYLNIIEQSHIPTVEINNAMTTTSNHTMCIHHIDKLQFPHQLPANFHPHKYGAAAIIRSASLTTTTSPLSLHSIGNLFYAQKHQRSMYPTLTTELNSTTDDYTIYGRINVRGKVKRSFSNNMYDLVDVPAFKFEDISLSPQPPALFLYLTTRSGWNKLVKDEDIFIPIEGDGNREFPGGSFYEKGSYRMSWPLEGKVDIRDYMEGYWFLWCTTFTITLAVGPIEIVDEY